MAISTRSFHAADAGVGVSPRVKFLVQGFLIILLACAVRAYDIGEQSLWSDELFSRYYADLFGLKFLWTSGFLHENSPPLYYMLLAGWMRLLGTSEAALRSLSLVASVLALPLVYLVGRELFDRRRGLLAALAFALSPMQISFAQEARTYALLLIPVGATLLAIARFLRGDMRARILCLFADGAILSIYCHATAVFFVAACNIAVVAYIASDRRMDRRAAILRWIAANAVVGLASVPELVAVLHQGRTGSGIQWIPPFRPVDVIHALSPVVSGVATPDRFPGAELTLLLLVGIAGSALVAPPGRRAWAVLIVVPMIFTVLIAIVSLFQPIFITRVFCWTGIPFALLLAYAIDARSRFRPFVAITAAITFAVGLGYQYAAAHKEPWRELFREIGPELARADHVVLAPLTDPTAFAYYAPYLTQLQMWDAGLRGNIENDEMPQRMGVQRLPAERLINTIKSGESVWLVLRTPDLPHVSLLLSGVPAPGRRVERNCDNMPCIIALGWSGPGRGAP